MDHIGKALEKAQLSGDLDSRDEVVGTPKPVTQLCVFVAIGRNEGERLKACLTSLQKTSAKVVYVDSGSSDGSADYAAGIGAKVIQLDMAVPFTAARARNAGATAATAEWPDLNFLHFIDGDCRLAQGWLEEALGVMQDRAEISILAGVTVETHPEKSVYNMMCAEEWIHDAGEVEAVGGIMLVRRDAFDRAGGFNQNVIAAEDDEFCIRVRQSGAKIVRLGRDMAYHDADMTKFSQWWARATRAGHGFAQVGDLHPAYFKRERLRTLVWGLALPVLGLIGLIIHPLLILPIVALYGVSFWRTRVNLAQQNPEAQAKGPYAFFLTISKFPGIIGMARYWRRKLMKQEHNIIEYK